MWPSTHPFPLHSQYDTAVFQTPSSGCQFVNCRAQPILTFFPTNYYHDDAFMAAKHIYRKIPTALYYWLTRLC